MAYIGDIENKLGYKSTGTLLNLALDLHTVVPPRIFKRRVAKKW